MHKLIFITAALAACTPSASTGSGGSSADGALQLDLTGGSVRDERGDVIDFSTGEPVHVHGGQEIALDDGSCPAVYKYAYLMDEPAPRFGRETMPNPLAWQFSVNADADLDASGSAYRVRDEAGTVLLDWSPLPAIDGDGNFTIALHRAGTPAIPALGTETGKLTLEVRVRDREGREVTQTACWEHHPLAAPVEIEASVPGALFAMSLPADSPISDALVGSVELASRRFIQHAADPVVISLDGGPIAGAYQERIVDDVVGVTRSTHIGCANLLDAGCDTSAGPADPPDLSRAGALSGSESLVLVDEVTGDEQVVGADGAATFTLPGRDPGEQPHPYRLVISYAAAELGPPVSAAFASAVPGEFSLAGKTYTGLAPADAGVRCTALGTNSLGATFCTQQMVYSRFEAIDTARVDFDPITFQIATRPADTAAFEAAAYVTGGAISTGAMSWDAGDDDLPGPQ